MARAGAVGTSFNVRAVESDVTKCLTFVATEWLFKVFVGFDHCARNVEAFLDDVICYVGVWACDA